MKNCWVGGPTGSHLSHQPGPWLLLFPEFSSSQQACCFFRFNSSRDPYGMDPYGYPPICPHSRKTFCAWGYTGGKHLPCSSWDVNWLGALLVCLSAPSSVATKRNGLLFSFEAFCCCQGGDSSDLADDKTLESHSVEWGDKLLQQLVLFRGDWWVIKL